VEKSPRKRGILLTFKIKIIAKEGSRNPQIKRIDYGGSNIDLKVSELMREYIFRHGYTHVIIHVDRETAKPIRIVDGISTLSVKVDKPKPLSFSNFTIPDIETELFDLVLIPFLD
jgi:hypothetical protein